MDEMTIVGALATGAIVALRTTAGQAVKDAYSGLKTLMVEVFNIGSVNTLEKAPSNEGFQNAVAQEITLTPEVINDPQVVEMIRALYAAIADDNTDTELQSLGLSADKIVSVRDTKIKGISGFTTGVKVGEIHSGRDSTFENIRGKPKT